MTPEFILWGVCGYITLIIVQTARPSRNRSGWDFVVLTAVCSLINFALASVIWAFLRGAWPTGALRLLGWREAVFPRPGAGLLLLGLILAPGVGFVLSRVFKRHILKALKLLSGAERDLWFTDVFYAAGDRLLGKRVIVSLTSGKVYVGIFLQASGDPNESDRSIIIQPVMSGYRGEDMLVTFNTDYFQADETLPDIRLLLPMKNVQSIANFNDEVHATFIDRGLTTVAPAIRGESNSLRVG